MKSKATFVRRSAAASVLTLFIFITSAIAGPPLICHTIDIGSAKSLPWTDHNARFEMREHPSAAQAFPGSPEMRRVAATTLSLYLET